LENILKNSDLAKFCIPYVNDWGKTSLHSLIESYIERASRVYNTIYSEEKNKAYDEYNEAVKQINGGKSA